MNELESSALTRTLPHYIRVRVNGDVSVIPREAVISRSAEVDAHLGPRDLSLVSGDSKALTRRQHAKDVNWEHRTTEWTRQT